MARTKKQPTLRLALLHALTEQEEPVKDVIERALTMWESPKGKTPKATAATTLLTLQAHGLCAKPAKGIVCISEEGIAARTASPKARAERPATAGTKKRASAKKSPARKRGGSRRG